MSESLSQPQQWYDLKAIEALTQIPYSTLRPYAALAVLQRALGAEERQGMRGIRWPESSLPTWLSLADSIKRKTVQPGTIKNFLSEQGLSTETAIVPLSQSVNESLSQIIADAVREGVRSVLPAPVDGLWTLKEAKAETGIPPVLLEAIRFKIGRKWYVKKSECYRLIESL